MVVKGWKGMETHRNLWWIPLGGETLDMVAHALPIVTLWPPMAIGGWHRPWKYMEAFCGALSDCELKNIGFIGECSSKIFFIAYNTYLESEMDDLELRSCFMHRDRGSSYESSIEPMGGV